MDRLRYGTTTLLSLAGLLALVACGGGASSSLTATPSDVAFGEVVVGTSASRIVTLTNTGDAALTVADVLATGSGIAASGPALPLILAPGESATISVQFAPATSGDVAGTVSVRGEDPDDPLAVVTYAAKAVHVPASIAAAPALVELGDVAVGASAAKPVTLTNDSAETVNITSVTSTSAAASASGLALPAAVAPGASRTFELVFAPTAVGPLAGHLALRGDSSDPLAVVEFRGSGTSEAPRLSASPLELAFGDVALGTFASRSVTLTNASQETVTIAEVVPTGAGVSTTGLDLPASLAPGASATLNVAFTPTETGPESGSVSVLAAGGGEPLAVVAHSGNGVASASPSPEVAVSAAAASVVGISVSPTTASVPARGTRTFTARVTGTTNTGVWWGVREGAAGGSITAAGVYTAPATPGTYHVITRSRADTTKTAVATVTVTAAAPTPGVAIAISPTTVSIPAGGTRAFSATVTGTTNTAVWWGVQEGAAGGTITEAGVYTAPATPGTYHVRTRSKADSTKLAVATVTVTAAAPTAGVAIAISPTTASIPAGGTRAFSATVTGTTDTAVWWGVQEGAAGGTITEAGVYTAPATPGTYHVRTRSKADSTKLAVATITVTAASTPPPAIVAVSVSPTASSLAAGGTQAFTATVTGASNTAVTWSVQEGAAGGSITSAGVYTAPATAGTYRVVARSQADATRAAIATVTVIPPVVTPPPSGSTPPPPSGTLLGTGWTGSTSLMAYPRTGPVTSGGPIVDIDDGLGGKSPEQRLRDALALLSSNDRVIIRNNSNATVRLTATLVRSTAWSTTKQVFAYGTQRIKLDSAGLAVGSQHIRWSGANREHWKGFDVMSSNTAGTAGSSNPIYVTNSSNIKIEDFWVHHISRTTVNGVNFSGGSNCVLQDTAIWHNGDGATTSTNSGDGVSVANGSNTTGLKIVRTYVANAADDGFDLYGCNGCSVIDSVSFGAGKYWNGIQSGDGNCFKMEGGTGGGNNTVLGSLCVAARRGGVNRAGGSTATVSHVTSAGVSGTGPGTGTMTDFGGFWVASANHSISWGSTRTGGTVNAGRDAVTNPTAPPGRNCWNLATSVTSACANPVFADPPNGDFSLRAGSPFIGAGENAATLGASTVALQLLKDNWTRR